MARTIDVEMTDESGRVSSAPTSPPAAAAANPGVPSPVTTPTTPNPQNPAHPTMDVAQIQECVDRLTQLQEGDVMLDVVPAKPAAGATTPGGQVPAATSPGHVSDEEMDVDNDDFRSDGYIRFVANNVSRWKDQSHNLSENVMVRNMPWRILLMARSQGSGADVGRTLGFFLQCNGENDSPNWSISATAELTLVNHIHPEKSSPRRINHVFYNKENDWGYSNFLTWKDLTDPAKGWVDQKTDSIIAECKVHAEAPHGVDWDSKRLTGFVGLKNQGATCYMNSLLQSLYCLNKLRKAVYQMPTEGEDSSKNVPLALQRVFYELQTSAKSVGTKKLTRSFGWDNLDSFMQHDVQELTRVLLDNIETKMKGSRVEGVIPDLFQGKMLSYIKCKNVSYISSRTESFYDIQLSVKGKKNVYESFKEYVAIERMEGDNKYDAGAHGFQEADKGVIFTHFPPVLHLHLMRFSFDYNTEQNIKINDRYEFPQRLNLDPFLKSHEASPAIYVLHAVLVHTGDNHGGHYVVYINHAGNNKWCKFDDEVVSRCIPREAVLSNYGGVDEDNSVRNCTNAYMLVYVRESLLPDLLCTVDEDIDIPEDLKLRLEEERNQEAYRRREREEAMHYLTVGVVTEEAFFSHAHCDLIPQSQNDNAIRFQEFRVRKDSKNDDLMKILSESYGYPENQMRLWPLCPRDNQTTRPSELEWDANKTLVEVAEHDNVFKVFLELKPPNVNELTKPLPTFNKNDQICLFFKYFDFVEQKLAYVGHFYVHHKKMKVKDLFPELCKLAGIAVTTDLLIFEEVRHFTLEKAKDVNARLSESFDDLMTGDILVFQRTPPLTPAGGGVLGSPGAGAALASPGSGGGGTPGAESGGGEDDEETVQTAREYFRHLSYNMDITFSEKSPGPGGMSPNSLASPGNTQSAICSITITCSQKWTITKLCTVLGRYLQVSPDYIQLHKIVRRDNFTEQTQAIPSTYEGFLKDLFFPQQTPLRGRSVYNQQKRLLYQVLDMKVMDFEARRKYALIVYDYETRDEHEVTLFPLKQCRVADLLEECARLLHAQYPPVREKGLSFGEVSLRIRLVDINNCKCHQIYDHGVALEEIRLQPGHSLRIDYFPIEQKKIAEDEMLVGVAHYSKEIFNLFGTPFYLIVKANESFKSIQERISKYLDLAEKDLEKTKFTLVNTTSHNAVSNFDPGDCIKLAKPKEPNLSRIPRHANSNTFIGLDHATKNVKRGANRFQHSEKSIQILN